MKLGLTWKLDFEGLVVDISRLRSGKKFVKEEETVGRIIYGEK